MPKTNDIVLGGHPTMYLFKGHTKSRKTTAAASYHVVGPMYFADCDGRIDPVKKAFPEATNIEYDTFTSMAALLKKKDEFVRKCPFKTIVFPDSMTNLCEMVINYSIDQRGGSSNSRTGKTKGVISLVEYEDYNAETRMISELLDDLKIICHEQGVNVIVTCHTIDMEIKNKEGKTVDYEQLIVSYGKKVAKKIPTLFNEVYHFKVEDGITADSPAVAKCFTQNNGRNWAGTCLPGVPAEFDWSNKNFYETLMSYVKRD